VATKLWAIMWQAITKSRMNTTTIERVLEGANSDGKLLFLGEVARENACSEEKRGDRGRYEAARSRNDGFGSGARNAMEKSVEHLGELGVTMIAGSGDFSSTKGKVRSTGWRGENGVRLQMMRTSRQDANAHLRGQG